MNNFILLIFFIPLYYNSKQKYIFSNKQINSIYFRFRLKILLNELYRNYDTSSFILQDDPISYNKCKICSFHPKKTRSKPNSSNRDAILTIGMGKLVNLLLFVKTLRTTGSKCRFILFLDDSAMNRYDKNFYSSVKNCGVEFVNFHRLKIHQDIACLRFQIYSDFLIINRYLFNRIYLCDLFDTVIQHDPFTTDFGDSLYLCDEGFKIREDSINTYWVSKCLSDMKNNSDDEEFNFNLTIKNRILNSSVLNSGLVAGSINNMIEYCLVMSKMINITTLQLNAIYDQGFHNLIVHSGYLKKRVNYVIEKVDSELFASIGVYITHTNYIEHNDELIDFGNIKLFELFPGIVHQFDRSRKIKKSLLKYCPNNDNFTDYIRNI